MQQKKKNMLIVHISGSPGAGKTFLGEKLQKRYPNIIVKDTDEFVLHDEIDKFIEEHKNNIIIFTGVLDTYKFTNANLLYLDTPVPQLLEQYYNRLTKLDEPIWEHVALKRIYIPSSLEKMREIQQTKEQHVKMGYILKSSDEIEQYIASLICETCKSNISTLQCVVCTQTFCNISCSTHACTGEFLRYRDTNYIFGTKLTFTIWKCGYIDNVPHKVDVKHIFDIVKHTPFRQRTENDHPQCCDIPYRVIEYNIDKVVNIDDATELAEAMENIYHEKGL